MQLLENETLRDLPFPSEKIRTEELFLTPIITPPPRGRFITIRAFKKPGDSPVLAVRTNKTRTYRLGDENISVGQKDSLVQIRRGRINAVHKERIGTEKFPMRAAEPCPAIPLFLKQHFSQIP